MEGFLEVNQPHINFACWFNTIQFDKKAPSNPLKMEYRIKFCCGCTDFVVFEQCQQHQADILFAVVRQQCQLADRATPSIRRYASQETHRCIFL